MEQLLLDVGYKMEDIITYKFFQEYSKKTIMEELDVNNEGVISPADIEL